MSWRLSPAARRRIIHKIQKRDVERPTDTPCGSIHKTFFAKEPPCARVKKYWMDFERFAEFVTRYDLRYCKSGLCR